MYRPNTAPKADLDIFATTMTNLLESINDEHLNAIIMGDTNIDLLKYNTHEKTESYLNDIISNGFLPIITKPTRIARTSSTLLDHIYINSTTNYSQTGIIISDLSDHYGTVYISTYKRKHSCD